MKAFLRLRVLDHGPSEPGKVPGVYGVAGFFRRRAQVLKLLAIRSQTLEFPNDLFMNGR